MSEIAIKLDDLNEYDVEVLEMLAGKREGRWGAAVSVCLEFLAGRGLCSRGPNYRITPSGHAALFAISKAEGTQP